MLLEAATGLNRTALLLEEDRPLGRTAAQALARLVERRLVREPVFRILGVRSFRGLDIAVTRAVLDPRPDTETVVEAALAALGPRRGESLRVVDLGVGSGAILAALLDALPAATGLGVDRSLEACRVAVSNLRALGLAARSAVAQGDWAAAIGRPVDLVVANPPYIETADLPGLDPEVRDHDPAMALDGGADGLDAYRAIVPALRRILAPGGIVALEVGWTQAEAVAALLAAHGLAGVTVHHDLGGNARAIVGRSG